MLAPEDEERVASFLVQHGGIQQRHIVQRMHLTVYHAQRDMPGKSLGGLATPEILDL